MKKLTIVLLLFMGMSFNLIAQNKEIIKEQASVLQAPRSTQYRNVQADPSVASYNSRFFGVVIFGTTAVVKSRLNTPTTLTTITPTVRPIFGGSFNATGIWYGLEYIGAGAGNLVTIDTTNGAMVTIGSLPGLAAGHTVTGLSWNGTNSTMYALSTNGTAGTLYTINLATSALTPIGNTTGSALPIDMSFNSTGILYSVDIGTDMLNTLNITTGAATSVGPLGVDLNFAQGMCIDPSTDSLFLAAYNLTLSAGQLLRCNTSTGATTLIGNFGTSQTELDGFVIPRATMVGLGNTSSAIVPDQYELAQNYPNPFNPTTTINFSLPKQSNVILKIYDIAGKEVETLLNESITAGQYDFIFDASSLSSGVYFYELETAEFTDIKRMTLIK